MKNLAIALTEIMKRPDVQKDYQDMRDSLGVKEILDMPIKIIDVDFVKETNMKGEVVDMAVFKFVFMEDENGKPKQCKTQAYKIVDILKAIGKERIIAEGGIITLIEGKKLPTGGLSYEFSGL